MPVSDPVLAEVARILRENGAAVDPLFQLPGRDAVRLEFEMAARIGRTAGR